MSKLIDIEPYEKLGYRHLIKLNGGGIESATYTPVDEIPTVNIESVVHGHWNHRDDTGWKSECSVCKALFYFDAPYCLICGAKMDKDGEQDAVS